MGGGGEEEEAGVERQRAFSRGGTILDETFSDRTMLGTTLVKTTAGLGVSVGGGGEEEEVGVE